MKKVILIFLPSVLILGNGKLFSFHPPTQPSVEETLSKVLVVTDNSQSYVFEDSARVFSFVYGQLKEWFNVQKEEIKLKFGAIGNNQNGFREDKFKKEAPLKAKNDNILRQEMSRWEIEKKKWLSFKSKEIAGQAIKPGKDPKTDIFTWIKDIEEEKRNLQAKDRLYVVFLSDMIHDANGFNLAKIKSEEAAVIAKKKYAEMRNELSKVNSSQVEIWIRYSPPKNSSDYRKVRDFWKAFFDEWGIKKVDSANL